ncbi:hypothetical protein CAPTEDRAFT_192804 [Capitella teleta]|uniref:BTB domain-containing protein n=1 Tax=Capitella teleta TaxID=283909 RepID=R7TFC1_CAPTE|nr:hypothetical protein CAPTEDRAFT_192804 [Capitella teleta]|eukprot:ELT92197.1 hypothetical protein CAPTEDRAFT_192804 [Capitella teleta]
MTDVTLTLPDQSAIPCHKVVLMTASPFFETMFQSGLKEGAEQNIKLDFADSYTIRSGKVCDLKVLLKTAFNFILLKFREFREISYFDTLTEDELVEVVSCDRLNAENEDVVFEAVVHWVNADPDATEEIFPRIAPLIHFPFCSQKALTDKICRNPLMQKHALILPTKLSGRSFTSTASSNSQRQMHSSSRLSFAWIYAISLSIITESRMVLRLHSVTRSMWLGEKRKCATVMIPKTTNGKSSQNQRMHEYVTNEATVWKGKILLGNAKYVEEYDSVKDRRSNRYEMLPDGGIRSMTLQASHTLRESITAKLVSS